jgi:HEPN domain-containing protein
MDIPLDERTSVKVHFFRSSMETASAAEVLIDKDFINYTFVSGFPVHLAIELLLKSVIIHKMGKAPRSHNLTDLMIEADINKRCFRKEEIFGVPSYAGCSWCYFHMA